MPNNDGNGYALPLVLRHPSVFQASTEVKDHFFNDVVLFSSTDHTVEYSGPILNSYHLATYKAIVEIAINTNTYGHTTCPYEILLKSITHIGRVLEPTDLFDILRQLTMAHVAITRADGKPFFLGALIAGVEFDAEQKIVRISTEMESFR